MIKCSNCQKENTTRSTTKGLGKKFSIFTLRTSYQCNDCKSDFKVFKPPLQLSVSIVTYCLIVLMVAVFLFTLVPPPLPEPVSRKIVKKHIKMSIPKKKIKPAANTPETAGTDISKSDKAEKAEDKKMNRSPDGDSTVTKQIPDKSEEATETTKADIQIQKPDEPESKKEAAGIESAPQSHVESRDAEIKTPEPSTVTISHEEDSGVADEQQKEEKNVFKTFQNIHFHSTEKELKIIFQADDSISAYKTFFLENPSRLVIDLPGKWKKSTPSSIKTEDDLTKLIRIWGHPDKLRIVMDLKYKISKKPDFKETPEGLMVTIRK